MRLFFDTNNLLDLIDERRTGHESAKLLEKHLETHNVSCLCAWHNLASIDYAGGQSIRSRKNPPSFGRTPQHLRTPIGGNHRIKNCLSIPFLGLRRRPSDRSRRCGTSGIHSDKQPQGLFSQPNPMQIEKSERCQQQPSHHPLQGLQALGKGEDGKVALAILISTKINITAQWLADKLEMGHICSVSQLIKIGKTDLKVRKLQKNLRSQS